jgi:hypothetical protein
VGPDGYNVTSANLTDILNQTVLLAHSKIPEELLPPLDKSHTTASGEDQILAVRQPVASIEQRTSFADREFINGSLRWEELSTLQGAASDKNSSLLTFEKRQTGEKEKKFTAGDEISVSAHLTKDLLTELPDVSPGSHASWMTAGGQIGLGERELSTPVIVGKQSAYSAENQTYPLAIQTAEPSIIQSSDPASHALNTNDNTVNITGHVVDTGIHSGNNVKVRGDADDHSTDGLSTQRPREAESGIPPRPPEPRPGKDDPDPPIQLSEDIQSIKFKPQTATLLLTESKSNLPLLPMDEASPPSSSQIAVPEASPPPSSQIAVPGLTTSYVPAPDLLPYDVSASHLPQSPSPIADWRTA